MNSHRVSAIAAACLATATTITGAAAELPSGAELSAEEIVAQCRHDPEAQTGKTTVHLVVENMGGSVTKERTLVMFWKRYHDDDLAAKQTFFVTGPPEFKDNAYLRWEPPASSAKPPDQWLYLTNTQRTRRIATRDPDDLTWGLIGEDLKLLQWPPSTKKLIRVIDDQDQHIYDVELVPSAKNSIYGKIISRYQRGTDWSSCVHLHSEFFDHDGAHLKDMDTQWSAVDGQRVREAIVITSEKSKTKTTYRFSDTVLNPPLDENIFTARALAYAERYLGKAQDDSKR